VLAAAGKASINLAKFRGVIINDHLIRRGCFGIFTSNPLQDISDRGIDALLAIALRSKQFQ